LSATSESARGRPRNPVPIPVPIRPERSRVEICPRGGIVPLLRINSLCRGRRRSRRTSAGRSRAASILRRGSFASARPRPAKPAKCLEAADRARRLFRHFWPAQRDIDPCLHRCCAAPTDTGNDRGSGEQV